MELQKLFGANVRNLRKARGWTQEQLAERVDVTYETIGKIERGQAAPSFDVAEKIALAFSIAAPVLFGAAASTETGERTRLLTDIQRTLSKMNDDQLARTAKALRALAE